MYLLTDREIDALASGKLKPELVKVPDKIALMTWSGEDVREFAKRKGIKVTDMEYAVRLVIKSVGYCDYAIDVEAAVDSLREEDV